ncbi:hypothetical protein BIFDEN_02185 [Bifidobacterium dentium ATCC 27678]|nr:hypothetical protein BIFDEN_02185 [Bifidobacterium dentium ATCC 27678]
MPEETASDFHYAVTAFRSSDTSRTMSTKPDGRMSRIASVHEK